MKFKHVLINKELDSKVVFETFINQYTQVPYILRYDYTLDNGFISKETLPNVHHLMSHYNQLDETGYVSI